MNLRRFEKKTDTTEEMEKKNEQLENGIVKIEEINTFVTVCLSGKIDATNFEEIQTKAFEYLQKENVKEFVFDMNFVNYVSSAGLRMFSAVNHKAAEMEVSYKLSKMREDIMKLFQMTGYASAFLIELKDE